MGQERLSDLALLSTEREAFNGLKFDEIIDVFAGSKARKLCSNTASTRLINLCLSFTFPRSFHDIFNYIHVILFLPTSTAFLPLTVEVIWGAHSEVCPGHQLPTLRHCCPRYYSVSSFLYHLEKVYRLQYRPH